MDKGEVHIWMGGRSWPAWYYDDLPEGVRPAQLRDLVNGRAVLYRVSIGPHAGQWGTEFCRPSTRAALAVRIRAGEEIFVK